MAPPTFIPGLELARRFYAEAVAPILGRSFADLEHSAALIGPGSEVLGFDTVMSTDHGWGPRVQLFLREKDHRRLAASIRSSLAEELPTSFLGYSTHFEAVEGDESMVMRARDVGPVRHQVSVTTLKRFFAWFPGFDPDAEITAADWLVFPQTVLRSVTAGDVFRDDLGLDAVRARLRWYPRDVWLYLLASVWLRIGQEEPFVGRTGAEGDELGSRILASRLSRDVMRICFLMEREYAPYPKWFGTAFAALECAPRVQPALGRALAATTWKEREAGLCDAYREAAQMHNDLSLTDPLPTEPSPFWDRPFRVIHGDRFASALRAGILDPEVKRIAERRLIGSVDTFSDSTDVHGPEWHEGLRRLYD